MDSPLKVFGPSQKLSGSTSLTEVEDTWDIPFNKAKVVCASDPEVLKKLRDNEDVVQCQHETEAFLCSCKSFVRAKRCSKCGIIFCKQGCPASQRTDSSLRLDDEVEGHLATGDVFGETKSTAVALEKELEEVALETVKSKEPVAKTMEQPRINPFRVSESLPASVSQNRNVSAGRGRGRGRAVSKYIVTEEYPAPGPAPAAKSVAETQNTKKTTDEPVQEPPSVADDLQNLALTEEPLSNECLVALYSRFAKQNELASYGTTNFVITAFYSPMEIFIKPLSNAVKEDFDDLLDEINDICLESSSLSDDPEIGTCVCAKTEKGDMQRAIALRKLGNKFLVRFLDAGLEQEVNLEDMRPFQESLFQTPLMGYIVKLRALPSKLPMLSLQEFQRIFVPQACEQKWTVSEAVQVRNGLWEAKLVSKKGSLTDLIMNLQTWKWESLFKSGCRNDVQIREAIEWPCEDFLWFPVSDFPKESPTQMQLSRIDLDNCTLSFKNVRLSRIQCEQQVFERQLKHYLKVVCASQHYPKIKENFIFLPRTTSGSTGSFWRRAVRINEDMVYCHDTDEYFPLKICADSRLMCPEFYKVPTFILFCTLEGEESSAKDTIAKLKPGGWYHVVVKDFDTKRFAYVVTISDNDGQF